MQNIRDVRDYLNSIRKGYVWKGQDRPFRRITDVHRKALVHISYNHSKNTMRSDKERIDRCLGVLNEIHEV